MRLPINRVYADSPIESPIRPSSPDAPGRARPVRATSGFAPLQAPASGRRARGRYATTQRTLRPAEAITGRCRTAARRLEEAGVAMRWLRSFRVDRRGDVDLHRRRARPRARQPLERTGRSRARPLGRSDSDRRGSIGAALRWLRPLCCRRIRRLKGCACLHSTHSRTGASRRGHSLFDLLKGAGCGQRSSSRCALRFSVSVTRDRTAMRLSRRLTPSRSGHGHPRPGRQLMGDQLVQQRK
jgi:hypothetical protein